jgi:hypothetical protein
LAALSFLTNGWLKTFRKFGSGTDFILRSYEDVEIRDISLT